MVTDQQRIDMAMEYVEAAKEIVQRTRDAEATQYLEFILSSGVICRIHRSEDGRVGKVGLSKVAPNLFSQNNQTALGIIPAYDEDGAADQPCHEFYMDFLQFDRAYAMYRKAHHEIFLRSLPESPFMKGNFLLHEAGHAYLATLNGTAGVEGDYESEEKDLEEGQLHSMNARLQRLWGGPDYQVILEKAFYRMDKQSRRRNATGTTGPAFHCDESWSDVFDRVFGPAPDQQSRARRLERFVLVANLEWIERKGWQPLAQIRAQAIRAAGV